MSMAEGAVTSLANLSPEAAGRAVAMGVEGVRDLVECVTAYAPLFHTPVCDEAMLTTTALAPAVMSPWLPHEKLRTTSRTTLWALRVDWEIDYAADSYEHVMAVVHRCMTAVEEGHCAPNDRLAGFLVDLRARLAASSAFPQLGSAWSQALRRGLEAMAREWKWRTAQSASKRGARLPTLEQYLDNADSVLVVFLALSHWISTDEPGLIQNIDVLMAAAYEVQRAARLVNDFATCDRDRAWKDLNALLLPGVTQDDVARRLGHLHAHCAELLQPLIDTGIRQAVYLDRFLKFMTHFHTVTDAYAITTTEPER
ncbi:hypothetical protein [Streptomyces sp. NPDC053560]|uniref:terpene synthase family protein n=1 Tax=Streptomyces sp. NPDC053560 TaxID=3365711 RepID=UPI0037D7EFDA